MNNSESATSTPSIERVREAIQHMTDENQIVVRWQQWGEPERWFIVNRNNEVVGEYTTLFGKLIHQLAQIEAQWIIRRR